MTTAELAEGASPDDDNHSQHHQSSNSGSGSETIPLNGNDKKLASVVSSSQRNSFIHQDGNGINIMASADAKAAESLANECNGKMDSNAGVQPRDGGIRAWSIVLGSFIINGVLFSIINTFSLIFNELSERLKRNGETEVSSKAALVGSLTMGSIFLFSVIAGVLTDKVGIQRTTFLGGAIAAVGMYLSSFMVDKVMYLYLTFSLMYGVGASLAYTPSLVILGHYFKKHLGLVNGIVTTGSSIFTMLLPFAIDYMLKHYQLEGTFRNLAYLTAMVVLCSVLFKPIPQCPDGKVLQKKEFWDMVKDTVNVSIWKKKKYAVWASAIPLALFGYFVPYVYIGDYVKKNFDQSDERLPVMCIGISSGIGRLIFGYIADMPRVNKILLQQISFVSIGILTMLLTTISSYSTLLIISLGMGLFDGCFISLLGPIAFDICGQKDAAQAIGFLLGMCSVPLTVGPPIAGIIYDHTGSYQLPFFLAGVPPILGALAMFFIYRVGDNLTERRDDEAGIASESLTDSKNQNG
ncbi:hypothetical protein QAD02_018085 [Eretmocerus hayati]|uniref:Uncharacterized protein n=1 Tax=Eretmocerus hayati TaxID=131215 RepID=A0ACC2PGV6_9HYME|nr:hypothetical protein QAD02_018085 [Eretmocerus hayati]